MTGIAESAYAFPATVLLALLDEPRLSATQTPHHLDRSRRGSAPMAVMSLKVVGVTACEMSH
jgi:hypothetical protein